MEDKVKPGITELQDKGKTFPRSRQWCVQKGTVIDKVKHSKKLSADAVGVRTVLSRLPEFMKLKLPNQHCQRLLQICPVHAIVTINIVKVN